MSEYEIQRVFVINTDHILDTDETLLQEQARNAGPGGEVPRILVDEFQYGWMLHLPEEPELFDEINDAMVGLRFCQSFRLIVLTAWKEGCHWIRFDVDGPVYDGLKQFKKD